MDLDAWRERWGIPRDAINELIGEACYSGRASEHTSEAGVQSRVRLEASQAGGVLWRNNNGVLPREDGTPVRFGLGNDTAAANKRLKSADLIGVRPVTITPALVGHTIGQFWSRECKAPGWRYTGTEREQAQLRWLLLISQFGGDACFATGPGTI